MGSWSHEVLTNDNALDLMHEFTMSNNIKADVSKALSLEADQEDLDEIQEFANNNTLKGSLKTYFEESYKNNYLDSMLLAAAHVDVSLNGIDESILGELCYYKEWFRHIENNPMPELREKAIQTVRYIQECEDKNNRWVSSSQKPRKELLQKLLNRLED